MAAIWKLWTAEELMVASWFHPTVSRRDAESMLMQVAIDGVFLLRKGTEAPFSMSFYNKGAVKHVQIILEANSYKFGLKEFSICADFIQHVESVAVLALESGSEVTLGTPYPRDVKAGDVYNKISFSSKSLTFRKAKIDEDPVHLCYSLSSREGMLMKKGKINTAWKDRWFQLRKMSLLYFKDRETKKPSGAINLQFATSVTEAKDLGRSHCFR